MPHPPKKIVNNFKGCQKSLYTLSQAQVVRRGRAHTPSDFAARDVRSEVLNVSEAYQSSRVSHLCASRVLCSIPALG
eukprot:1163399-Pyramimonas_sp.AAC.1